MTSLLSFLPLYYFLHSYFSFPVSSNCIDIQTKLSSRNAMEACLGLKEISHEGGSKYKYHGSSDEITVSVSSTLLWN